MQLTTLQWLVPSTKYPIQIVATSYLLSLELQPHWRYVSELGSKPLGNVVAMVVPLEIEGLHHVIYHWSSVTYDVYMYTYMNVYRPGVGNALICGLLCIDELNCFSEVV